LKKVDVILKHENDLHARSASLFVKEASKYISDIRIVKEGNEYEAKSILGIIGLGAEKGDKITIVARGEDEEEAIAALINVLEKEPEMQ